jgi:hypothetical protein
MRQRTLLMMSALLCCCYAGLGAARSSQLHAPALATAIPSSIHRIQCHRRQLQACEQEFQACRARYQAKQMYGSAVETECRSGHYYQCIYACGSYPVDGHIEQLDPDNFMPEQPAR